VGTVEHLFAALAGAGIRSGVSIEIEGPEVPLVDGGARAFFDVLAGLEIEASDPSLRVAREAMIEVGESRYEFRPGARIELDVEVDFDPRLERRARWSDDPADFRERIATARTFGFDHEVEHLLARGLANHVTPESVVVICKDRILSAGAPFEADEPARHKLLDLIGDLYLHGGPPRGLIRATRPGHAATHEAMRRAVMDGVLIDRSIHL
jgi:UDP-3-O-[3-hydroxymyristoyl] N-acetylglucosamine deacetylase